MPVSSSTETVGRSASQPALRVDRVACTGHGVCARLVPSRIALDEWGYPIVLTTGAEGVAEGPDEVAAAVRWCPAMALYVAPST